MLLKDLVKKVLLVARNELPKEGIYRQYFHNGYGHRIWIIKSEQWAVHSNPTMFLDSVDDICEESLVEGMDFIFKDEDGNTLTEVPDVAQISVGFFSDNKVSVGLVFVDETVDKTDPVAAYESSMRGYHAAILSAMLMVETLTPEEQQLVHDHLNKLDTEMSLPYDILTKLPFTLDLANEILK